MKTVVSTLGVLLLLASIAGAQVKTLPREMTVVNGTVEAIDQAQRVVTIKDSKGKFATVDVPEGTERFTALKVGDKVSIRYYDTVSIRLKAPGEMAVDSDSAALTPTPGAKPAGTAATQRVMTATIQEIDPKVPSVTFVGPNGWKYSRRVADKKMLEKVKVGDRVDFIWTKAVIIDTAAPK